MTGMTHSTRSKQSRETEAAILKHLLNRLQYNSLVLKGVSMVAVTKILHH